MSERGRRRVRVAVAAMLVAAVLLPGTAVIGQPSTQRLLIFDVPYAKVWESTVREMKAYPLTRALDGAIETVRTERPPLPEEQGASQIAERITVRVEAVSAKITRVTVTVDAEALRDGRWGPAGGSPVTVRTVLDRIRAGLG